MAFDEHALLFRCEDEQLLGIVADPPSAASTGVLIVVGGPQYRAGSHRQFVHLARRLADEGIACMRFDYRGMGDSSGAMRSFEAIGADMRAAIDAFFATCPRLRTVALWGLCDGASAVCFYAKTDARVSAAVLVNPWVRTDEGLARVHLRHYYVQRLFSREFWRKMLQGSVSSAAATGFISAMRLALRGQSASAPGVVPSSQANVTLPERMALALLEFRGSTLVILSGDDYTAKEFCAARSQSRAWARALRHADTETLEAADHTFSQLEWKERVAAITASWIRTQLGAAPERNVAVSSSV